MPESFDLRECDRQIMTGEAEHSWRLELGCILHKRAVMQAEDDRVRIVGSEESALLSCHCEGLATLPLGVDEYPESSRPPSLLCSMRIVSAGGTQSMIVGFVQPYSHYAMEGLRYDCESAHSAHHQVASCTAQQAETIRIEQSKDGGRALGIFVHPRGKWQDLRMTAEQGAFFATDDPDTIIFRLHNGHACAGCTPIQDATSAQLHSHDLPIALPKIKLPASRRRQERGADRARASPHRTQCKRDTSGARAESSGISFRMVEVAIMLLLPLLAVALAVPPSDHPRRWASSSRS